MSSRKASSRSTGRAGSISIVSAPAARPFFWTRARATASPRGGMCRLTSRCSPGSAPTTAPASGSATPRAAPRTCAIWPTICAGSSRPPPCPFPSSMSAIRSPAPSVSCTSPPIPTISPARCWSSRLSPATSTRCRPNCRPASETPLPTRSTVCSRASAPVWRWRARDELTEPATDEARACLDTSWDPDAPDVVLRRAEARQLTLPRVWEAQISELANFTPDGGRAATSTRENSRP